VLAGLADVVFPRLCPGCGERSDRAGRHVCWRCVGGLPLRDQSVCERCGLPVEGPIGHRFICGACRTDPPAFDQARSASAFGLLTRRLIHLFKYNRHLWLREDLVDLLDGCLRAQFDAAAVDLVVPVPLHPAKRRARTYNQAALLAGGLARRLGKPHRPRVLARVAWTSTQTRLSRTERRKNVLGVFKVADAAAVRGRTVLLVDDVMTTGATLHACARILKKAGAARVWCVTVARGA